MPTRIITDQELSELVRNLKGTLYPFQLAFGLWANAGLRLQESRSLAWSDLVYIDTPLSAIKLQTHVTKYNRQRTLPVNRELYAAINWAWTNYGRPCGFAPANFALAPKPDTDPVSGRTLQRRLAELSKRVIGRSISPHVLRHTFATRLLKQSSIRTVQEALGHRHVNTTERYTHVTSEDLKNGVDRLGYSPPNSNLDDAYPHPNQDRNEIAVGPIRHHNHPI